MDVEGRVVAVTGAAHGIGEALVRAFAAAGARLAVLDIDAAAAAAVAGAVGGRPHAVDVTDADAVAAAIDDVEAELGPIELFWSNAGIFVLGGPELPDADWQRVLDVNVLAHVHAARVLVPRMLARGGGYLGVTASAAGLLTQIGSAPYSVSKHAAVAFAEWLAITYGDRGLRVSVLCPQAVATAMTAGSVGGGVAGVDGMMRPDEVAAVALAGVRDERFLLLPHPEVAEYERRRSDDRERWLAGMRRLQARFLGDATGHATGGSTGAAGHGGAA